MHCKLCISYSLCKANKLKITALESEVKRLEDINIYVGIQMAKDYRIIYEASVKAYKKDASLKNINWDKIESEINNSLKEIDTKSLKVTIEKAMKDVDMAKIQKEIRESLAKVDFDNIKLELEKVKNIDRMKMDADMKKLGEEMKELGPKLEKEMQKAKVEIEKAKVEMKEYKSFVDGLANDGLINKKETYSLKHKDGELFINGKKASEQTYSKYRNFLEKHKKFNIEKNNDDFNLDMD